MSWSAPRTFTDEDLARNRERLLERTRAKLQEYEARYELPSSQVIAELKAGRLRETAEICDWFIAYETFVALRLDDAVDS